MALSRTHLDAGGLGGAGELRDAGGTRALDAGVGLRRTGAEAWLRAAGTAARRRREQRRTAGADFGLPVGAEGGVADPGDMRPKPDVEGGAALGAVEDSPLGLARPEEVDDRTGRLEDGPKRCRAAGTRDVVRDPARSA